MEKLKIESNKKYNFIFLIFGVFAIAAAIIVVVKDNQFIKNAVEIKATVVECNVDIDRIGRKKDRDVALYVDYVYEGEEYKHILAKQREEKEHEEDSTITIYIDPQKPREPLTDTNSKVWLIILLVGGGFFGIGVLLIMLERNSEKQRKYLKENGLTVYAKLVMVRKANKSMNSPLELRCTYCDEDDRDHTFVSEPAYNDLTKYFSEGEMIEVKVMPGDYSKYYIDLEALWEKKTKSYSL